MRTCEECKHYSYTPRAAHAYGYDQEIKDCDIMIYKPACECEGFEKRE